ncbi:MAG TPA: iron ABC transporter permease [Streptosporangiaceae bacterium]|jgi:iron(III) transport system permease protein|nr:iron ABC transporter permease [Streptosporangiaceae bacterium]
MPAPPAAPTRPASLALATVPARRARRPVGLLAVSTAVAALLAVPLAFLLLEAHGAGVATVAQQIFRPLTGTLLWNTVRLTALVTLLCAFLGTGCAWLVERTNLPGRQVWAVLLVIPLAIPDFVVSFGWSQMWTWVQGFRGAVLVMTLAVYPLVYLPVAASLRSADPGQEEVARSLGAGRLRTFARITLGQARGAILGGCLLAALVILAEYGAFNILGFQTFTTEIYQDLQLPTEVPTACALSLVLVAISLVVLGGEARAGGRGRAARSGPMVPRLMPPLRLGAATIPALLGVALLVVLALGVPLGESIYLIVQGGTPSVTSSVSVSMLAAAWHTAGYGIAAGVIDTLLALPVAVLAIRHTGAARRFLERSTYLVLAMPGVVIALALTYFSEQYLNSAGYQTAPLLIICYVIMFFPLALVGVKAAIARAPASLDEVARSLGQRRLAAFSRVTMRLAAPGLIAAFCLVFLSVVTELTATLVLVPTGVQTLATQFWQYQTAGSYSQAAPFAVVMIAIAALPSIVLGRFFNRASQAQG